MKQSKVALNAKVAAISFPLGAFMVHVLNQFDASLLPLRLLAIGVLVFGVWAFADEMGLRKPLNRAGFVGFAFSMLALSVIVLNAGLAAKHYFLIYAFGLLFSLVVWSAAFMHRQKSLKIVGAVGAFASILPLLILIASHISLGVGAIFGTKLLFDVSRVDSLLGSLPLNMIEGVFVLWALVAAQFLWRGKVSDEKREPRQFVV